MNSSISNSRAVIGWFFFALAIALISVTGATEWLVRTKVAPEDVFYKHITYFNQASSAYAAFGDSHVARGYDATSPVVNLGYPSENIEKMAWKAAQYLKRIPNPEAVLIQADPHLFADYRMRAGLEGYPNLFAEDKRSPLLSITPYYRPQIGALWKAFLRNGGKLKSKIEFTEQGSLLSPGNLSAWTAPEINAFLSARTSLHKPAPDFETSRDARLYKAMIENFIAAGTNICLVAFPVSPAYRARVVDHDVETKERFSNVMRFFQSIASDSRVTFIDHRHIYNDPAVYRDPDHLNQKGAQAYGPVLQGACFPELNTDPSARAIALAN